MHHDSEWQVVYELGKLGFVHLIDMNATKMPTELPYTEKMKEIEKAELKMRDIKKLYEEYSLTIKPIDDVNEYFDGVLRQFSQDGRNTLLLDEILGMVNSNHSHLQKQEALLAEQMDSYKAILQKIEVFKFIKNLVG